MFYKFYLQLVYNTRIKTIDYYLYEKVGSTCKSYENYIIICFLIIF